MKISYLILRNPIIWIIYILPSLSGQTYSLTKKSDGEILLSSQSTINEENLSAVFLVEDGNDTLRRFNVKCYEEDFDCWLESKKLNGLKGYTEVIQVNLSYTGCCSSIYSYYFLKNKDNSLTSLPTLYNVHCDGPEPKFDYVFPSDTFGTKGMILKSEVFYTPDFLIDTISVVSRLCFEENGLVEIICTK